MKTALNIWQHNLIIKLLEENLAKLRFASSC